jgi:SAM-dependent methyltransferase
VSDADAPSRWLVEHADLLPHGPAGSTPLCALDLASGRGRNALWLAGLGYQTIAIDAHEDTLAALRKRAADAGVPVEARALDLERPGVSLGRERYDVIVVFRYLHRPLFPALRAALRPGGVLVYETYTTAQAARGRPSNPRFLLERGELLALVAPLRVLRHHEGDVDGAMLAGVVARLEAA